MSIVRGGQAVRFVFDPRCPWSWRASLWLREARARRPIAVEWRLLSLAYLKRGPADATADEPAGGAPRNPLALRALALARQRGGMDAIDRLYLALGEARHARGAALDSPETVARALREAGLDATLLDQARGDTAVDGALLAEYRAAVATGAFGVPTLYFGEGAPPWFGPVLDPAPRGEAAARLYDHLAGLADQPGFFEFKRPRA